MKKILVILFVLVQVVGFASSIEDNILLKEIKVLIEQNGKKIEQNGKKIEQNAKKIDLVDSRIDNVEKRLDFMQNIIYIILAAVFGLPLYLDARKSREEKMITKTKEDLSGIMVALRELAQDDPKVRRSLDVAGL